MIWNTIPNEEKLRCWKKLRKDMKDLPLSKKLESVAEFCSKIPYGSRTVDYYTPSEWPTPWEILFHGTFCTSSISILIYYSLILEDDTLDIKLYLVEDDDGIYLLPVISNQFVLNYELGAVSNIADITESIKVLDQYSKEQIRNIK